MSGIRVVTGGGGFIGHHLVRKLSETGPVLVLDNFVRGVSSRLDDIGPNVITEEVDITDFQALSACLKNYEIAEIFHLAAINGTANFYSIPIQIMDVGVLGCYNLLKYARSAQVHKFIFASSAEVYQEPAVIPTPEDVALVVPNVKNPRYSYALSKIYTEYYAYQYAEQYKLNMSIFRPHNVYGPDMGLQHVIPQFIMQFLEPSPRNSQRVIKTKGSLEALRSFCYVDDIVNGLVLLSQKNTGVNVYNLGNTEVISMKDLLFKISDSFGFEFDIDEGADTHTGGAKKRCPDISKAQSLGFRCEYDLRSGLDKTVKWYQDNVEMLQNVQGKNY
jgi:UDP-glucose 4-epimerase